MTLGAKLRHLERQNKIRALEKVGPSAQYKKYINAISNDSLINRWHKCVKDSPSSPNCKVWVGPKELFSLEGAKEVRYQPRKILIQLVAGPGIRPERVRNSCEGNDCMNVEHHEVIDLEDLNDELFSLNVSQVPNDIGRLTWNGKGKFRVFNQWGSRLVGPQKYLIEKKYPNWQHSRVAYFQCRNSNCVNVDHIRREKLPNEIAEENRTQILLEVYSLIDESSKLKTRDTECILLSEVQITELVNIIPYVRNKISLTSKSDANYIVAWYALASLMYFHHAFFAMPSGFSPLGTVSLAQRKKYECKHSSFCYRPSHRHQYLTSSFERTNGANRRDRPSEKWLVHSSHLSANSLDNLI